MTKGQLIKSLEDYDDDAHIAVVASCEEVIEDGDILSLEGGVRMGITGHVVLLEATLPVSD